MSPHRATASSSTASSRRPVPSRRLSRSEPSTRKGRWSTTARSVLRCRAERPAASALPTRIDPRAHSGAPAIARSSVVLPEPVGPVTTSAPPAGTAKSGASRTTGPPGAATSPAAVALTAAGCEATEGSAPVGSSRAGGAAAQVAASASRAARPSAPAWKAAPEARIGPNTSAVSRTAASAWPRPIVPPRSRKPSTIATRPTAALVRTSRLVADRRPRRSDRRVEATARSVAADSSSRPRATAPRARSSTAPSRSSRARVPSERSRASPVAASVAARRPTGTRTTGTRATTPPAMSADHGSIRRRTTSTPRGTTAPITLAGTARARYSPISAALRVTNVDAAPARTGAPRRTASR